MAPERPRRPRFLVIADEWPWPSDTGFRHRLHHVIEGLASVGDVDYLGFVVNEQVRIGGPPDPTMIHDGVAVVADWLPGFPRRLARWMRSGQPWVVSSRDWHRVRAQLGQLLDGGYDMVWLAHSETLVALADLLPSSGTVRVLDVDNVPTTVLASKLRARRLGWTTSQWLHCAIDAVDLARWRRIERRLDEQVDRVVLCSDLDSHRVPARDAVIVPNGYTLPAARCPRALDAPRVITMVGTYGYAPNRDGILWFVDRVLPGLRKEMPDIRLRVVGSTGGHADIRQLAHVPGVEVTGYVEDVAPHVVDSSVVIAPIRFGGGTRIKILEAFAYGSPVVSTTVGCEGLDVQPGRHLLVGDTSEEFARACLRLLTQPRFAQRVAQEGHALFRAKYVWAPIVADVADLAAGLVQGGRYLREIDGDAVDGARVSLRSARRRLRSPGASSA